MSTIEFEFATDPGLAIPGRGGTAQIEIQGLPADGQPTNDVMARITVSDGKGKVLSVGLFRYNTADKTFHLEDGTVWQPNRLWRALYWFLKLTRRQKKPDSPPKS